MKYIHKLQQKQYEILSEIESKPSVNHGIFSKVLKHYERQEKYNVPRDIDGTYVLKHYEQHNYVQHLRDIEPLMCNNTIIHCGYLQQLHSQMERYNNDDTTNHDFIEHV
eukprot:131827_1